MTGPAPRRSWSERARGLISAFKREVRVYRAVLADRRTPWPARVLLGLAVGYLFMPFDLIPDWIPVLGLVDDVIIVPGLVWLAMRFVPRALVEEHRGRIGAQDGR
jgi:uncharacterized membrane protein YkvA (DUF1232 family)